MRAAFSFFLGLVVLGACGDDGGTTTADTTSATDAATTAATDASTTSTTDAATTSTTDAATTSTTDAATTSTTDAATTSTTDAATTGTTDATTADGDTTSTSERWLMGYYAGYEADLYPVDAVDWGSLTHLAIAFYLPNADGTLQEHLFIDDVNGPALARALVAAAHAHGVAVIASIGGAGMHDAFAASAAPARRATFVNNLVDLVDRYDFDGLDLDWEPVLASDVADLTALVTDLRAALPSAILTMPVGIINANFPDDLSLYATLAATLDQINIMSYGMAGPWDGWKSWHSSALYHQDSATPTSIDSTVQAYLDAGVPAARLGVGAGFYGLCYSPPVDGPDQDLRGATITADDGAISYTNVMADYDTPAARRWDDFAHASYLSFATATGPAGCGFLTFEDPRSLADKAAYVVDHALGGVIVWTIGQGYLAGAPAGERSPLLRALATGLR